MTESSPEGQPGSESEPSPASLHDPNLLWRYEPYLRMLARSQMPRAVQAKVDQSDIVQQSLMQAVRGLDDFRGQTEAELRGWLRQILAHEICHTMRDLHREKRDIDRERSIEERLTSSSMRLEGLLAGDGPTPSQKVAFGEDVIRICRAIEQLPSDQRDAIRLHFLECLSLSACAKRMDKTVGAIAGLLHRGKKSIQANLD